MSIERQPYPDPLTVDWQALSLARQSAVSGVIHEMHLMAQAIDEIGTMLSAVSGKPWTPISDRVAVWPDEREPRFRKEPPDGTL